MRLSVRRTIAAPPEVVFAVYTDPARLSEWQPGLRGLSEQTGPLDQAGTTYVLDQPGPRLRVEVLRVHPPRFHEQRECFRWYGWIGQARFGPSPDGGTRFSYRYTPTGRYGWLWFPVIAASAIFVSAEFNRLKKIAELQFAGDSG